MTEAPTFGDFVEAIRRGQVLGDENGTPLSISRLERRLRDGRVVQLRACRIHSGLALRPQQLVVRP